MQITHYSSTVLAYARALLELATEKNEAEPIGQELEQLHELVQQNPVFAAYVGDPAIGHEEMERVLRNVFQGKVSPLMWNFMGVLNMKGRLKLLSTISAAYSDLLDEQQGKIEVDVTVAKKLTDAELQQVQQQVSAALKKEAFIHQFVEEEIIGGMILRVQDKLIDGSVRSQLEGMRKRMLGSAVPAAT